MDVAELTTDIRSSVRPGPPHHIHRAFPARARTRLRSLEPVALVLAAVALALAAVALGRRRRLVILVVVLAVLAVFGIHRVGQRLVVGVTLLAHGGLLRLEDGLLGRDLRAALPGLGDELGELLLVARLPLVSLLRLRLLALCLLLRGLLRLRHHLRLLDLAREQRVRLLAPRAARLPHGLELDDVVRGAEAEHLAAGRVEREGLRHDAVHVVLRRLAARRVGQLAHLHAAAAARLGQRTRAQHRVRQSRELAG
mmetsp:Transcript_706/g.1648  ORF Transcript_706/g.1648 Transcript_706/m.1648 type:complete len:254 (+) Transcript_706:82-843(+)